MISKKNRLSRFEFNQVKKSGRKIFHLSFLIFYVPGRNLKVSVVVSKKIAKKAVRRNLLRRHIYDHLAKHYPKLSHNIIIYLQKYEENLSALDQALSKLP